MGSGIQGINTSENSNKIGSLNTMCQQTQETQLFIEASRAVLECDSFIDAARCVFEACRKLTSATSGYVALLRSTDQENEILVLEAGEMPDLVNSNLPMPIRGLRAQAYEKGIVVFENDLMKSEHVRLMPPGHVILNNVMFVPLRLEGKVAGIMGLANKPIDFTEDDSHKAEVFGDLASIALRRSRSEESLRESEIKFRLAFMTSPDAFYWATLEEGRIIEINPVFEEVFGYTRDEIIGKTSLEIGLFHFPADRARMVSELKEKGFIKELELNARKKNGEIITISISIRNNLIGNKNYILGVARDITERKLAEDALKRSELQISHLFDNSPSAIAFAHNGNYVRVNNAFCNMFGYDKNEIIGNPLMGMLSPESLAHVGAMIKKREQGDSSPFHFVTKGLRKNGQAFDLEIESSVCVLEGKKYSITHHRDITERKQFEEHSRKMLERLSVATQAAQMGIWDWDIQKNELVWDNRMYALYGIKRDAFKGAYEAWLAGIHPEDKAASDEISRQARSGEKEYDTEFRVIWPDKSIHYIKAYGLIERDLNGNPLRMTGVNFDITEPKRAELLQMENEKKYRALFSQMNNGCALHAIICDAEGNAVDYVTLEVNDAYEKVLGAKREDVVGKKASEILPKGELEKWVGIFGCVALTGKPTSYEMYSPVNNKYFEGNVYCPEHGKFVGVFLDISARKMADEALQRTQKLESLGILAGGIAHDFNNLLGGIYGYLDLAGEIATEPKLKSYLSKSMATIDRGRHLTQQLLTFAKGGAPIKSVGSLFPHVREVAQFALSGSNISCSFEVPENLHFCDFDKNQIAQVIDNLIINAKQAMPDGGKITVSATNVTFQQGQHASLSQGEYVKISIRDQGIGMPKEILPRIFEPFFTTKATGHGLGLATCYSIIKRHGGLIDVESESGKGSTFHVILPATENAPDIFDKKSKDKHSGTGTFIVMDDEEVIREMTSDMLKTFGYKVICTEDGQEAVEMFASEISANNKVAALILDLTIPGAMGGREAINEIRKISVKTPVFVASGYADNPIMANPKEYGFVASICKPFRKSELSDLLNMHL